MRFDTSTLKRSFDCSVLHKHRGGRGYTTIADTLSARPVLILADGLLHALLEQDPETSLRKFVRYNTNLALRQTAYKKKEIETESLPH